MTQGSGLRLGEAAGRWTLAATVLGSGMAGLDATVVNIALPAIGAEFDASFAGLQWTITGYTLTLASLILLGGSLGDRFGRRRVFVIGAIWFAAASAACAAAPTIEALVAARALQGIGGALLTPGSLAIISASFAERDRGRAIGAWSGLGGIATAIGPFVGGYLVAGPGWRSIFLINLPLAVAVVIVAVRHVPETRDPQASTHLDVRGALLGTIGLAGLTYGLIAAGDGWSGTALAAIVIGVVGLAGFVVAEHRSGHPMVPPGIFADRQFAFTNVVTFAVYAALGAVFFLLVVDLQVVGGYSAIVAGAALLPVTLIMLVLSPRAGDLAARIGPRLPMSAGPVVAGVGVLLLLRGGDQPDFFTDVLPAMVVFGFGLALLVAPLTATALGSAPTRYAGVASGVNNAVARAAGLLAVATVPLLAGISGDDYLHPAEFADGFAVAMVICAALLLLGGAIAAVTIRNVVPERTDRRSHCAVEGPPVQAAVAPEPATR